MFETDLLKTKFTDAFSIVVIIFALLIAPFWYIFQFAPELYKTTDLVKLLVLSAGIGAPVLLMNSVVIYLLEPANETAVRHGDLGIAAFCSTITYYFPCLFCFFIHLTTRNATLISTAAQLILVITVYYSNKDGKKANA